MKSSSFLSAMLIFASLSLSAQPRKMVFMTRDIQVSLVPGINSNGLNSAQYFNKFSFNLLAGMSAGTQGLEVGLISNASTFRVQGIQFAGVANVVGTNSFIVEPDEKLKARDEKRFTPDFRGIQFAGIMNYVDENTVGFQFAGFFNSTRKTVNGVQVSGFGNTSGGPTNGLQFGGLYNISGKSMAGVQISLLANITRGLFSGTQIGLVNRVGATRGPNSLPPTRARGLQIGLINLNRRMDGLQVGLVNMGGKARGIQVGLVNFYRAYPSKENVKQGIPIGLLNFRSRGPWLRVYNSELFPLSAEYSSGQCRNCSATESQMPYEGRNQIYYHNSLIVGSNPPRDMWAFGYGFQRLLYNKVVMPNVPANKTRVIAYGLKFRYLQRSSVSKSFNLLSSLNFDYGKRFGNVYFFGSLTLNHFVFDPHSFDVLPSWTKVIGTPREGRNSQAIWPGYGVGVLL